MKKNIGIFILVFIFNGCSSFTPESKNIESPNVKESSNSSQTITTPSPSILPSNLPKANEIALTLETDIEAYSEIMSSSFGIGLTPKFNSSSLTNNAIFRWKTDYGHFLSQDKSTFKIEMLGKQVDYDEKKIYWSYSSEKEPDIREKEINVLLDILDKSSGSVIASSKINFEWDSKGSFKKKGTNQTVLSPKSIEYNKEFSLTDGVTAVLPDKSELKVDSIIEDSRCPENSQCIWAGQVVFKFSLKKDNKIEFFNLVGSAKSDPSSTIKMDSYSITMTDFDVQKSSKTGYSVTLILKQ